MHGTSDTDGKMEAEGEQRRMFVGDGWQHGRFGLERSVVAMGKTIGLAQGPLWGPNDFMGWSLG